MLVADPASRVPARRGFAGPLPSRRTISVMARLLIAEDDEGIRVPLVRALRREGYEVDAFADGSQATAASVAGDHDLVIIDVGLPGTDGMEMCRRLRAARPAV